MVQSGKSDHNLWRWHQIYKEYSNSFCIDFVLQKKDKLIEKD